MSKRITSDRVKKYGKIIGATGVPLAVLLVWFMVSLGSIEITGYSGDSICKGTELDPCYAYINFTTNEDVFIYPGNWSNTAFYTDIQPKSVKMYRSWGTSWREIKLNQSCTGTWCGLSNSKDTRKFAFAFREGRDYQIRYEILKYNPEDSIKWGFDSVDPIFYGFEVTNKLEYSNKDLDVNIKDALGKDIVQLKLISHENASKPNYVMPGKNRKVMIYEIENFYDYENAIKSLEIINVKNNKTENKQYHLEYAIYDYVSKPVYENFCSEVIDLNGSISNVCEKKIIDFYNHYEIIRWENLTTTNLLKGNLTIALVTDVKEGDYYDGIFTLFGKRLEKHATWTDGLTVGLTNSWNLNELSGTNGEDQRGAGIGNQRNLTFTGGPVFNNGLIGNGIEMIGGAGSGDVGDTSSFISALAGTGDFAISAWLNVTTANTAGVFSIVTGGTSERAVIEGGGAFRIFWAGGDTGGIGGGTPTDGSAWIHLVVQRESGRLIVYKNATLIANITATSSVSSNNFRIGAQGDGANFIIGMIDEVLVYNRSLTGSEVTDLYNGGTGITYIPPSVDTSPTITLNSPADSSTQSNLTLSFNCSATDDSQVDNVSLYINGVLNKTQTGGTNFTELTQTYVATSSGAYEWTCNAYDNATQLSWASSNFTVTIALNISGTLKYNNLTVVDGGDILITDQATNLLVANITTNSTGDWTYNVSSGMYLVQSYYPSTNASDPNLEEPDAESHVVVS